MSQATSSHAERLTHERWNCRIVIGIQKKVKQGKRNVASLFLRVKGGKDRVAAWRRDLVKVLQVFNVRIICSITHLRPQTPSQTELAIGTHMVVADIHRNVLEREDISSQEYSVTVTCNPSTTEC